MRKIRNDYGSLGFLKKYIFDLEYNFFSIGYGYYRTKKGPNLKEHHMLERYIWCRNHCDYDFSKTLFVDETTIRVLDVPLYQVRKRDSQPRVIMNTLKLNLKVNIWGGISTKGPTPFIVSVNFVVWF